MTPSSYVTKSKRDRKAFAAMMSNTAIALALAAMAAPMARAADQQPSAVEEVVVTGSRIVREGYDAPTPLTVVGAEQIATAAGSNLGEFVNTMPVFSGSTTPQNTSGSLSAGNSGTNQLNLRQLGVLRTLVLLDGQRMVGSTFDNAVDINTFPQSLVQRVDVVTGGASAVYGSDAVAGVVNFVLDKEFTGVKGEVSGGMTRYYDDEDYKISLTGGFGFAGGRGHVLVAGEHVDKAGAFYYATRKWGQDNLSVVNNPAYGTGAGQSTTVPLLLVLPHVGFQNAYPGGIITGGPLKGVAFGPAGNPFPFTYGSIIGGNVMSGGAWQTTFTQPTVGNSMDVKESRQSLFLRSSYDITDNFSVFAQGQYARSGTLSRTIPYLRTGDITVTADNAYIPQQIKAQMAALGVTSFPFGSLNGDLPSTGSNYARVLNRAVVGGNGKFQAFGNDWSYNFYYSYGKVRNSVNSYSLTNRVRYNLAIDAVVNPANGKIVCRSSLANPTNGCVPYNLFGEGVNNQEVKNYILGNAHINFDNIQQVEEAVVTGPLFDLWAGPVSTALSVTHRSEKVFGVTDAESSRAEYFSSNFAATNGHYNVTEGAVEVDVPLAKDLSWAKNLDTTFAARFTDYSISGFVSTWKAGVTYQPIDDIRFRANRSRDIRAPVLQEYYQPIVASGINDLLDPTTNTRVLALSPQGGNPLLKPEKADTTEIGVILQPTFVPDFTFSVDYWKIKIKDSITILGAQQILDVCYSLAQNCQAITRVNGVITQVDRIPVNLAIQNTQGLDFEASYKFAASDVIGSVPGDFALHANLTKYLKNYLASPITSPTDNVGSNAGPPNWRFSTSLTWTNDPINVTLVGRGTSSEVFNENYIECTTACPASTSLHNTVNLNHIRGAFYMDTSVTYKLNLFEDAQTDLFFNVKNLFDSAPPYVWSGNIQQVAQVNGTKYDILGRTYRAGMRFKF